MSAVRRRLVRWLMPEIQRELAKKRQRNPNMHRERPIIFEKGIPLPDTEDDGA